MNTRMIGILKKMEGVQPKLEVSQPPPLKYSPSLARAGQSIFIKGLKFGIIGYAIVQAITFIKSREFLNPTRYLLTSVIRNAMVEAAYFVWWLGEKALGNREQSFNSSDSSIKSLKLRQWIWKTIDSVENGLDKASLKIDQLYSDFFGIRRYKETKDAPAKDLYITELVRKVFVNTPFTKRIGDILSFRLAIGVTEWLLKSAVIIPIRLNSLNIYLSFFVIELAVKVMSLFNSFVIQHLIEILQLNENVKLFENDFWIKINNPDCLQDLQKRLGTLQQEIQSFEKKWPLCKDKWYSAYKTENFVKLKSAFSIFQRELTKRLHGDFSPSNQIIFLTNAHS